MSFIILLRFQNTNLWYSVKCSLNEKTSVKMDLKLFLQLSVKQSIRRIYSTEYILQ